MSRQQKIPKIEKYSKMHVVNNRYSDAEFALLNEKWKKSGIKTRNRYVKLKSLDMELVNKSNPRLPKWDY